MGICTVCWVENHNYPIASCVNFLYGQYTLLHLMQTALPVTNTAWLSNILVFANIAYIRNIPHLPYAWLFRHKPYFMVSYFTGGINYTKLSLT